MESVETTIISANSKNFFSLTMMLIDALKEHAEKSKAVQEIFDNVRMDFFCPIRPVTDNKINMIKHCLISMRANVYV